MGISRAWLLLIFLATVAAGLMPVREAVFDRREGLLYRDLSLTFVPAKALWRDGVTSEGAIPRWNHFSLGGVPYYADCNLSPLHPLNFVFLLFSRENLIYAMAWFLALHYAFLYLGGYFLLRTLRIPRGIAAVAGFGFAWNGFALSSANLVNMLGAQAAALFFLAFWIRHLRSGKLAELVLASLSLALPIYVGDPQYSYILALVALAMLLTSARERWLSYPALGALTFLAAAAQLLPTIGFAASSSRGFGGLSDWSMLSWSLHPWRLLDFFFPVFLGGLAPVNTYWGGAIVNSPFNLPFVQTMYCGGGALFLLVFGALLLRDRRSARARRIALAVGVVTLLLLTLGLFSPIPLYKIFARFVPFWGTFRYPERLGFWLVLLALVFQARTLRRTLLWMRIALPGKRAPARALFAFLPSLAVLAAAFGFLGASPFPSFSLVQGTIVGGGAAFLIALGLARLASAKLVGAALALLLALDLFTTIPGVIWTQPRSVADAASFPTTQFLVNESAKRAAERRAGAATRLLSSGAMNISGGRNRLGAEMDDASALTIGVWEGLGDSVPVYFGIDSLNSSLTMTPKEIEELWLELRATNERRALDIFGIRYVLQRKDGQATLLSNDSALPNVFLRGEAEIAGSRAAAVTSVAAPDFLPASRLVLDSPAGAPPAPLKQTSPVLGSLSIESRGGDELVVDVTLSSAPQYLVWNSSHHRNWRAYARALTTEGEAGKSAELPIHRANAWAMAVPLPAGSEKIRVRFVYEDPMIFWGLCLSALWLALAIAGVYFSRSFPTAFKRSSRPQFVR